MIRITPPASSGGGGGAVTTVAGRTGDVVIAESDVTNLTTDLAAKASALVASQSISGTATLVDGSAKMVLTDTTSAAFTLTLPAAPSSGSIFIIIDSLGTWNTNNLTVARNGKLIDGVASNATHVTQYGIVEYLYDGTGWRSKIRQLSQANPVIDGTATPGTALKVSREDHVHPTDTSRAPLASPTFTGTVTLPEGNDAAAGTASRRTLGTGATQAAQGSLAAPLASPAFTGTPAAPTPAANTNTTQVPTGAYIAAQAKLYGGCYQIGPGAYANMDLFVGAGTTKVAVANAGDGRWVRLQMAQSGTLHDVSFNVATTGGNYNILVLDDGQANATHTTRTCLYIKGSTATPAGNAWMTGDAALTVAAGDTLIFMLTFDGVTAQMVSAPGPTGFGSLPNSSFFPGSGASTASQKTCGTCLAANVPGSVSATVTDANLPAASNFPFVCWRIS